MKRHSNNLFAYLLFLALILFPACKKKAPDVRPSLPAPTRNGAPDPDLPPAPAPTVSLTASPGSIERGEQSTLKWSSEDGMSLLIDNGIGNVRPAGEIIVSPSQSTTYSATVKGRGGEAKASTRITVLEPHTVPIVSTDAMQLGDLIEQGTVKTVHFAYDKAQLNADAKATLQQNALYFRQYPDVNFVVEGHCDERGSEEYNLALGDRRAIAVRDYLIQLGLERGRMQSVSFGEELPLDTSKSEKAFARNRRAQFSLANQ